MADSGQGQPALAAVHSALFLFGFTQATGPVSVILLGLTGLSSRGAMEAGGKGLGYLSRVTGLLPLPGTSLQFPHTHSLLT